jgi:hypothetical protein
MYIENVDQIRKSVIEKNHSISESDLPRLTDLYIYFLLHAFAFLKPGGRLAVVTADSWLNVGYGGGLKRYLQQHFEVESLISLDRQVFQDAQVKPVLIFAIKKEQIDPNSRTHFIRVKNGLPVESLWQLPEKHSSESTDVVQFLVKRSELNSDKPWGIYFKIPDTYEKLALHPLMTPLSNLAVTRIGIQTLAKDFFVLSPERVRETQIEWEFLQPLAQSSKYFYEPIIEPDIQPTFYVFYCSREKEDLQGTRALEYILQGEKIEVQVRGKNITVQGYQHKERIMRSSRRLWYDLKTSLERRGCASILIPRLVYRSFTVVWNKAKFVPGELFIEFLPHSDIDTEVYLAILNSSIFETMARTHAQVYGGGTYNINPGQIKKVPILNADLLTVEQKKELRQAYLWYLTDKNHHRSGIDAVVYKILGFDAAMQHRLSDTLEDLLLIATSSKKAALNNP